MIKRTFLPGDEWVYYKIYAGVRFLDEFLISDLNKLITQLKKKKIIDKWFYIRYTDPDNHLRVRFHLCDKKMVGKLILLSNSYFKKLIDTGCIKKVDLSTYQRELERYLGRNIILAEQLFFIDSELIIKILALTKKNDSQRWLSAFVLIDMILTASSKKLLEKEAIMSQLSDNFRLEFGFNEFNSKQLNAKYREHRKAIYETMHPSDNNFELIPIIRKELDNVAVIFDKMNKKVLNQCLLSFIHMSMNRLFRTKNRIYELIVYDFLKRYYRSEMAKQNINHDI